MRLSIFVFHAVSFIVHTPGLEPANHLIRMFGNSRRHRPPNLPLNSTTANPNAASAAATAFMSASNQKPSKSLSSAAAAAALRARPHTPTNVGEVQTKRTIRRSASVSSAGSASTAAAGPRPTAQLERRGSSGSMTERTFRSPSPRRAGSIHTQEERPPVPQIPATHKKSASAASSGVGMQAFRTASQKMKIGHSSWYTEPSGDPSNVRTSDAPMNTGKPQLQRPQSITTTTQRPDSRSSSVNFSYPITIRAQSPPASPSSAQVAQVSGPPTRTPASPPRSNRASMSSVGSGKSDQQMIYDPNSRRMIPRAMIDNTEQYVKESVEKQPRKKKYGGIQRENGQFAKGAVGKIKGTTIDVNADERNLSKREQPILEAAPTLEESQVLEELAIKANTTSRIPEQYQEDSERKQPLQSQDPQKSKPKSPPPSQSTSKDLSASSPASRIPEQNLNIIKEPEVAEHVNNTIRPSQRVLDALDAVPTRQSIFQRPEHIQISTEEIGETVGQQPGNVKSPEQTETKTSPVENKPVLELSREGSRAQRSTSNSPARQAHFSVTPPDNLAVRHTPLPRSASPIKSALKRTSPTPREVSPSDKSSDMSGSRGASPHQRDETTGPRKKSVRVSFDDRTMATVVGESAPAGDTDDSAPPSPQQVKRPWYSNIGRGKRREFTLEDDEIMKPRPALPSFGSVRDKVTREAGERPLVRPQEPTHSPATPESPESHPSNSSAPNDTETPEELSLGQSSDQAVGSVLSRAQTSRNAPNISRFREPLPPVVTSVEGSGYISDSIRTSDSDDDLLNSVTGASDTEEIPSTQPTQLEETQDNSQNDSTILKDTDSISSGEGMPQTICLPPREIPEIAVIQPSPRGLQHNHLTTNLSAAHFFDVPGGFPDDSSEKAEGEARPASPPSPPIFEPKAVTTLATTAPLDPGDDDDAYEDLSDIDGDGFLSLNAVVEKPTNEPGMSQLSDTTKQPQDNIQPGVTAISPEPAQGRNDWEQAKAFWRSLTAEKRLQLEREAIEEAGTEGDEEDIAHPIRRTSNRKKTTPQQIATEAQPQPQPKPAGALAESPLPANPERAHTAQPTSKPKRESTSSQPTSSRMRMSMRAEKPGQADGFRKTMRSHGGTGQASQSTTHRTIQREKPRSASASAKPSQPQTATPLPQTPPTKVESPLPNNKPPLQRHGSDASDSSFKRSRATRNGGFGFRSSMRPLSAVQPQEATRGSGRYSLRSISPAGSSFQHGLTGNAPTPAMRRTLRSGSVSSQERILSSIHFPSFGRSNKSSTKRSKKSSRLVDSSDEDEAGISGFQSRFENSSDEDNARPSSSSQAGPLSRGTLRPSTAGASGFRQSTPVPEVDEDSPDLPDSDDAMPSPMQSPRARPYSSGAGLPRSYSSALGTGTLTRSRSGRGAFSPSVSLPASPSKEKRGSLLGILKRNKRADAAGKIQRSEVMESAARRDTRLERSNEQLKDLRGDYPSSPRLQKRGPGKRSDSWPLGEPTEDEGIKRSNSVNNMFDQNITGSADQRPDFSGRRSTSLGLPTAYDNERDNVTVDGPGHRKKKKFGALRRMFGLDD
ncbi:hypothetical protein F4804DRAFT_346692 [Jackrogersella minutella]|nr:hypothetical protein F4804DRAFT_346692 [Jackrogersella minutella]